MAVMFSEPIPYSVVITTEDMTDVIRCTASMRSATTIGYVDVPTFYVGTNKDNMVVVVTDWAAEAKVTLEARGYLPDY